MLFWIFKTTGKMLFACMHGGVKWKLLQLLPHLHSDADLGLRRSFRKLVHWNPYNCVLQPHLNAFTEFILQMVRGQQRGGGTEDAVSQTRWLHTSKYDYDSLMPPRGVESHLQGFDWNKTDSEFICRMKRCARWLFCYITIHWPPRTLHETSSTRALWQCGHVISFLCYWYVGQENVNTFVEARLYNLPSNVLPHWPQLCATLYSDMNSSCNLW